MPPVDADQLTSATRAFDGLFDHPDFVNARWGVVLADVDTSAVHYARDIDKSFMPASNLKLFTSAAALVHLGANFVSTTTLATTGKIDDAGTLHGDLLIHGTGDPSISGRYTRRWRNPGMREPATPEVVPENQTTTGILTSWAKSLAASGIKSVSGSVVALRSGFGQPRAGSWQLDYYSDWYAAEGSGVALNDNLFDIRILPGRESEPARIERVIAPNHIQIENTAITGPASKSRNPGDETSLNIDRDLDGQVLRISGVIPENAPPVSRNGAIHDGDLFAAGLLTEILEANGIQVAGKPRVSPDADLPSGENLRILHRSFGEKLDRVTMVINKPSQNFYADQVLRMLGKHSGGDGTFRDGEAVVRDYLTSAGVPRRVALTARLADGSGLSRQNSVTPGMTLALLRDMARRPEFGAFFSSLPVAGRDGTIAARLRNTPVEGHIHAKTGTINGVRCLSGYIAMPGKRRLAFVVMANNFSVPVNRVNEAIDQFLLTAATLD